MKRKIISQSSSYAELYKWGFTVLLYTLFLLSMRTNPDQMFVVRLCVSSSLFLLGFEVYKIVKLSGTLFTPCLIFLALYYIFQNGLLVLLAFQDDFYSSYLNKFSDYIVQATIYSSISNVIAGLSCIAAIFNTRPRVQKLSVEKIDGKKIYKAAVLGFFATGIVAIPLVLAKFSVARSGGYHSVRTFEENIPFFVNFVEYLFMPFALLTIMYANKNRRKIILTITFIWLLLTSLCGDRTVGLSGILIVSFISFQINTSKGLSFKSIAIFGLVLIGLMVMVQFISVSRNQGDISTMGEEESPLMHFMSELGFSCITLFSMMDVVPQQEPFLHGTGYLGSLISGIIPANADPTGFVRWVMEYRNVYSEWFEEYFNFSFGLGFSLNSEAYINFGWYGFFPLFFLNYIIFHFLNYSNPQRNPSTFDYYSCYILLFLWCTLPRRDSYYIWKALVYGVLLIKWYLYLTISSKHSSSGRYKFGIIK